MRDMVTAHLARRGVAAAVLIGVMWLLWSEMRRNWASMAGYRIVLSSWELVVATLLGVVSFLLETRAWQRAMNATLGRTELGFAESIAMVNTSGLLKYLPGRVWTYGAQMMWLAKRGVSKGQIVYVNLACLFCSILTSTVLGGAYLILYVTPVRWAAVFWLALAGIYGVGLLVGPRILAASFHLLRRFTGHEIAAATILPKLILELGVLYALGWGLMGIAGYYLARGVGLPITAHDVIAITASMAIGWIVGYLSALTPGGLGVREGLMYLMLGWVSSPQSAIILPLVSRLLYLAIEALLGSIGLVVGMRRGLFRTESR